MSIIKIEYQLVRKIIGILPILLILLIALIPRLLWFDRIPTGITGDELDYVFNAKAIYLTGKDISGTWSPFSLRTPPNEVPKAELPYLLIAPIVGPADFSLFMARLPFVFSSVLLVFVLFLVGKELFNEKVGLIAALVGAINPWSIYFGRTGYDAPLAVLFYLLAFYVLLRVKSWKILLVFPFFFVAFYLYIGTKLLFIPFVLLCIGYSYFVVNQRRYGRQYLFLAGLCLVIFIFFLIVLFSNPAQSRANELFIPTHSSIAQAVDKNRRLAMQYPFLPLFENKPVVYLKELVIRYFVLFSPQYLFLFGEGDARFSVWEHGVFYYLDALFLLIGVVFLFVKKKKLLVFFSLVFLVTPIPSLLSSLGRSFSIRSALTIPFLILLISFGIYSFLDLLKGKLRLSLTMVLFIVYTLLVLNFLHIYFFRNPIFNSEAFNFSSRVLSTYLDLADQKGTRVNVVDSTGGLGALKQYIFFTNKYDRKNANLFREKLRTKDFSFRNIKFVNCNGLKSVLESGQIVVMPPDSCRDIKINLPGLSIAQLSDGGEIYKIINDRVCIGYRLSRYPTGLKLSDFEVERLGEEKFCQTFITDLNDPQLYEQNKENQDE